MSIKKIIAVETEERILVSHISFSIGTVGEIWIERDKIMPLITWKKVNHRQIFYFNYIRYKE